MRILPFLAALILAPTAVLAQKASSAIPAVPDALEALAERGAQMRFLGREHGLDGWIAIYQGQEQYYYVTQDGKAFVTGLMFGADGRPITIEQVRTLQSQGGEILDMLMQQPVAEAQTPQIGGSVTENMAAQTPAERMFADVQNSNIVRLGSATAPVIYSFVDPQCPHCHKFINDIKADYLDKGVLQVRLIPVGFQESSLAQAAFLLAAPDGAERFYKHLAGDNDALPAKNDISTQAVQKNMALMQAWKFNVTPLSVYRSASGEIKIVRGVAKDIPALISDLPAAGSGAQ